METFIRQFENKVLQTGEKIEEFVEKTTPKRKYLCEVFLRVPLFFIIHQWLLVSPYSEYRIFDFILFIPRFIGVLLLFGSWTFNTRVALLSYVVTMSDIVMLWLQQITYWTFQEDANDICIDKTIMAWSDVIRSWRLPVVVTVLLATIYLCFRMNMLAFRLRDSLTFLNYAVASSPVLLDILCIVGIFPGWLSELSYWVKSFLFTAVIFLEAASEHSVDNAVDVNKKQILEMQLILTQDQRQKNELLNELQVIHDKIISRNEGSSFKIKLPGKWFFRDSVLGFGITYFVFMFLFEILVTHRSLFSFASLDTILEISAAWCTSYVILIAMSFTLGIMSNICIAFCYFFLSTEFTLTEVFDANIGGVVQFVSLIAFLETDILSLEYSGKLDAIATVCLFSFNAIIFQVFDVLEKKLLHAVNRGQSPGLRFCLKVGILTGLLVTVPSLATYHLARKLFVEPWILFFASGNSFIILNMLFLVVESSFTMINMHTTNYAGKLEDALHYFRLSKSIICVLVIAFQLYCRLTCGLFKSSWLLRIAFALFNFVTIVVVFYLIERKRVQVRHKSVLLMDSLIDVSYKKDKSRKTGKRSGSRQNVSAEDDSDEDSHDCPICYSDIVVGKMLPCGHAFHKECIKRWLQIKLSCPFCNTQLK